MKKIFTILLSLLMVTCFAACGNATDQAEHSSAENNSAESGADDSAEAESSASDDVQAENSVSDDMQTEGSAEDDVQTQSNDSAEDAESDAANDAQPENTKTDEERGNRILVVYFSATNTTEGVAEHIANGLNADIYEIVPEEPYTDADLNYNDNNSRSTIEMNDPNVRPAILGSVENMEQYEIVFIGYPIWHGQAPHIISTFLESYDFSGKTIIPFCTSHSSGIGSSADNLRALCPESVIWLDGKRFESGVSKESVSEWIGEIGIRLIN